MLFGHGGLEYFLLRDNLHFTENVGHLVYSLWHIAVVMFLLKILIGLTSAIYAKIQVGQYNCFEIYLRMIVCFPNSDKDAINIRSCYSFVVM